MVAHITEGTAFDKHGRPFRRRNPRPGIIVVIFLVVVTGVVWTVALTRPTDVHEVAVCNPPPEPTGTATPTKLGSFAQLSRDAGKPMSPQAPLPPEPQGAGNHEPRKEKQP